MRKYIFLSFIACISLTLVSWGVVGHKTVATIAENHLTPKAKAAVKTLLGDTAMADIASWADQVLREPSYKHTASWHYLNVPLGLSYKAFADSVTLSKNENVYSAIQKAIHVLNHENNSIEKRREALKFLIHFVGDLHQPMHISRAEDKGGNTIQLQYEGKGTNLHSLWDSKLIGTENKSFEQMAVDYDKAMPEQIKQWQSDDIMKWLYESYQISSQLYADLDKGNRNIDAEYYKTYIPIIHLRINQAGIRLAGLLNKTFDNQHIVEEQPKQMLDLGDSVANIIDLKTVKYHIGETVAIEGKVYDFKKLKSLTLINLGGRYPKQNLTIVLKGNAHKKEFPYKEKATIVGRLELFKGKPQMVVTDPKVIILSR